MVSIARIRMLSTNKKDLDDFCNEMKKISKRTGVRLSGPIHLPTKHLVVPTQKSPCGEGTTTWEHYEMRIHKRLIDIDAEEKTMRQIIRLSVPSTISVEIELKT